MVAGLSYLLIEWLWRRSSKLCLWYPSQQAASIVAFLCAALYVLMAGFAIPAERALIACALLLITATLASITYANADAVDDIQRSKVIKVCIWPDYFGISYRNPRTGALQGIDIELSQAFASDLGAKTRR